jgi:hypothetical protein
MAKDNNTSGTIFEGLLNNDPAAVELLKLFSDNSPKIVSPTVGGLLQSFDNRSEFSGLGIDGCKIDYSIVNLYKEISKDEGANSTQAVEDQQKSDASIMEFAESLSSFIDKVSEIRSSYLPIKSQYGDIGAYQFAKEAPNLIGLIDGSGTIMYDKESHENAVMRMLGMPSDSDIGDLSQKLFYISPDKTNGGRFTKKTASLGKITGKEPGSADQDIYADILIERQRTKAGGRRFNFENVPKSSIEFNSMIKNLVNTAFGITKAEGEKIAEAEKIVGYHLPDHLFRFFYLKSVPLQDSSIYGCISEPSKIVMQPFDKNSYVKVNGVTPHTSLLETIIRIRLDRITGNPVIYSSAAQDSSSGIGTTPSNVGMDQITEVECFLIQKLKNVLYILAEKYISEIITEEEIALNGELNKTAAEETQKATPVTPQTEEEKKKAEADKNADADQKAKAAEAEEEKKKLEVARIQSDINRLEFEKTKEDSILFLLKDTSSSSNTSNSDSIYSSLDIQQGIMRTSSGFNDVLSAPLYSILSYRSKYLEKLIAEKKELINATVIKNKTESTESKPDPGGFVRNQDGNTYKYLGIRTEDFIIYSIALLSIDQDYLIGLLSTENRRNLGNTISSSITGRNKDPYGIIARLNGESSIPLPTVYESVNALAILVADLYEKYINYIKNENVSEIDKFIKKYTEVRTATPPKNK